MLLRKPDSELVYRCAKQHNEPGSNLHDRPGAKVDEIALTPLERLPTIVKPGDVSIEQQVRDVLSRCGIKLMDK